MTASELPVSPCVLPVPLLSLSPRLILISSIGKPIRAWHLSQITAHVCSGSAVSHKTMISITSLRQTFFFFFFVPPVCSFPSFFPL